MSKHEKMVLAGMLRIYLLFLKQAGINVMALVPVSAQPHAVAADMASKSKLTVPLIVPIVGFWPHPADAFPLAQRGQSVASATAAAKMLALMMSVIAKRVHGLKTVLLDGGGASSSSSSSPSSGVGVGASAASAASASVSAPAAAASEQLWEGIYNKTRSMDDTFIWNALDGSMPDPAALHAYRCAKAAKGVATKMNTSTVQSGPNKGKSRKAVAQAGVLLNWQHRSDTSHLKE